MMPFSFKFFLNAAASRHAEGVHLVAAGESRHLVGHGIPDDHKFDRK